MRHRASIADDLRRLLPADLLSIALRAAEIARSKGTRAVLVGGVVRDVLLGRAVLDADIMVEPPVAPVAHELAKALGAALTSHSQFQTFAVKLPGGRKIDVVTAREETYPAPGVLPKVEASTIEKDLRRRDFTINAMVCHLDPSFGEILDPFKGRADLEAEVIRALHETSFFDDPTRIFRAARFAGRLGFTVEPKTASWIQASIKAEIPQRLSPVRRRHEFEMILKENAPTAALLILAEWDALRLLHPNWKNINVTAVGLDGVRGDEGGRSMLVARLAQWFRWWGPGRAKTMLDDLNFERTVKRDVLGALGVK